MDKESFIGQFIIQCHNFDRHNECCFALLPNAMDEHTKKKGKEYKIWDEFSFSSWYFINISILWHISHISLYCWRAELSSLSSFIGIKTILTTWCW